MPRRCAFVAGLIACVGGLALAPAAGHASVIIVETTADELNTPTGNGDCSLREAVITANDNDNSSFPDCAAGQLGNQDFISLPAGTITLTEGNGGALDFSGGGSVRIGGEGDEPGNTLIDADDVDRAMHIRSNVAEAVDVVLADLAIEDGNVPGNDSDGGAILVDDPDAHLSVNRATIRSSHAGRYGGAISFATDESAADLEVHATELVDNSAGDDGGALYLKNPTNCADTIVNQSVLAGNTADGVGGAIYEVGSESGDGTCVTVRNSTLSGNSAAKGGGALGTGNLPLQARIEFATIAGNSTPMAGRGGGIQIDSDLHRIFLTGTILASNTAAGAASNCARVGGAFEPEGTKYSLESADTCGLTSASPSFDLVSTDPLLAPLADNGGDTRTRGLYDGSPARSRVPVAPVDECGPSEYRDQRGFDRISPPLPDPFCDVGAFEGTVGPAPPPAQVVRCGGRKATRVGTANRNVIKGTPKVDVIAGLGGNDVLRGLGGNDVLCGGNGNDRLIGGSGRDALLGQGGKDILRGGPGRDKLKGGPGRDKQIQ